MTEENPKYMGDVQGLAPGQVGYVPVNGLQPDGCIGAKVSVYDRPFRGAQIRIEADALPMTVKATCVSYADVMAFFDNPRETYHQLAAFIGGFERVTRMFPSDADRRRLMPEVAHIVDNPGVALTVVDR